MNLCSILGVSELLRFHIYLKCKNITTLDYLKLKDKVRRESKIIVKLPPKISKVEDFSSKKDEHDGTAQSSIEMPLQAGISPILIQDHNVKKFKKKPSEVVSPCGCCSK